jgi:DNA-binding transcriptional LysR family regulator
MSLDLQQLRYLSVVAEEGQITRAAARLHIAQPALSQAIARMEQRLDVVLFTRHSRGITLTPAGVTVLEKARAVLTAAADAEHAAHALARAAGDTIAVGFVATPPSVHCPELLEEFDRVCPECELRFVELPFPSGSPGSWLREVDAALCFLPTLGPEVDFAVLRRDERSVILSKSHPLAASSSLDVADVIDQTFVGFDPDIDPRWRGLWSLDDHRGEPPSRRTHDQVSTPMGVLSAIVVDEEAIVATPAAHTGTLMSVLGNHVAIPLRDAHPMPFSLLWPRDSHCPSLRKLASVGESVGSETPAG